MSGYHNLSLLAGETSGRCRQRYAIRSQPCVARILGISNQAVQQIERRAFLKIRKYFEQIKAYDSTQRP